MVSINFPRTLPGTCYLSNILRPELFLMGSRAEREIASLYPVPLMLGLLPPSQQGISGQSIGRFGL